MRTASRERVPPSLPCVFEARQSTQGALNMHLLVMIDPLKSDGNRPYALGKGPTWQGGMGE